MALAGLPHTRRRAVLGDGGELGTSGEKPTALPEWNTEDAVARALVRTMREIQLRFFGLPYDICPAIYYYYVPSELVINRGRVAH